MGEGKKRKNAKKRKEAKKAKGPKKECCASKPRCKRCPVRMLAEGRLDPDDAKKLFRKSHNRKQAKKEHLVIPTA